MDGLWNAGIFNEQTKQQQLSRHRLLRINLSTTGLILPGDASSYGGLSPVDVSGAPLTAAFLGTGPHFVLSQETPDGSHTYGMEFCISTIETIPIANRATPPYTVTVWALVGTSVIRSATGSFSPIWAALAPVTVANNELFHTFDINASAIRFQIVDARADQTTAKSVLIAMSEL
jgi:hypothetical protein